MTGDDIGDNARRLYVALGFVTFGLVAWTVGPPLLDAVRGYSRPEATAADTPHAATASPITPPTLFVVVNCPRSMCCFSAAMTVAATLAMQWNALALSVLRNDSATDDGTEVECDRGVRWAHLDSNRHHVEVRLGNQRLSITNEAPIAQHCTWLPRATIALGGPLTIRPLLGLRLTDHHHATADSPAPPCVVSTFDVVTADGHTQRDAIVATKEECDLVDTCSKLLRSAGKE